MKFEINSEVCREVGPAAAAVYGALETFECTADRKGYFAVTNETLMEMTGHGKTSLQTALNHLKKAGLIHTEPLRTHHKLPPRRHFKLPNLKTRKAGATA